MNYVVNSKNSEYDVLITRESIWGNPYHIGKDGTRDEVIEKYRSWLLSQPIMLAKLESLRGKILGCVCKPLNCHGDVIVELIEYFHPKDCDLKDKPPHALIRNKKSWVDLDRTERLNSFTPYASSIVWLQHHDHFYYIITDNKNGILKCDVETIDKEISMLVAQI